jgi:hypothetical protein
MKKLFAVAVIFALALAACETEEEEPKLTINNLSGKTLRHMKWQGIGFTEDKQYGGSYHIITYYINPGSKVTNEVTEGSGYIYFETSKSLRTQELVVVDAGKDAVFTFTDNTVVVEVSNPGNSGPLSGF